MNDNLFNRTSKVPSGYTGKDRHNSVSYSGVFVGFVKDNRDYERQGALRVWIPELSGDKDEDSKWFTVRYMSPFAGASKLQVDRGIKNSTNGNDTQQSYGWWGVVPDLENEVVVMFANCDPARGIMIGCLYQEYMNYMVPSIPIGASHQPATEIDGEPPVMEYNKWSDDAKSGKDPIRPRFEPLHEGLLAEGLYGDPIRGPSLASPRASDTPYPIYGLLTPRGNHWYIEETEDREFIRIRTRGGTQVLIDNAKGFIYLNSKKGNSWVEISDEGIDLYSRNSISIRSQRDLNLKADLDVNIEAGQSVNIKSLTSTRIQAVNGNIDMRSDRKIILSSSGKLSLSGNSMSLGSQGIMSIQSGGDTIMTAPHIFQNSQSGEWPDIPEIPRTTAQPDTQLSPPKFSQTTANTIVSRMPAHEPWAGHGNIAYGGLQGPQSNVRAGKAGEIPGVGDASHAGESTTTPKGKVGKATAFKGDPNELGALSARYESKGDPGAIGWDSTGGWSYGRYQIASNTGTMDNYLEYLKESNPTAYDKLQAAGGAAAAKRGDPKFKTAWTELAGQKEFADSQHNFIKATHYDKAADRLDGLGLDVNTRSKALQDVVWSTSVQHGDSGTQTLFDRALKGRDPSLMSDGDIINALYDERSKTDVYFRRSTPKVQQSVKNRFAEERKDALNMLS